MSFPTKNPPPMDQNQFLPHPGAVFVKAAARKRPRYDENDTVVGATDNTVYPPPQQQILSYDELQQQNADFKKVIITMTHRMYNVSQENCRRKRRIAELEQTVVNTNKREHEMDSERQERRNEALLVGRNNQLMKDKEELQAEVKRLTRLLVEEKSTSVLSVQQAGAKRDEKWNNMFCKLQNYHQEHDTWNVKPSIDLALYHWVYHQRLALGLDFDKDTASKSKKARRQKLENTGFVFEQKCLNTSPHTPSSLVPGITVVAESDETWNERFYELQNYYSHFQTWNVKASIDQKLYTWMNDQRIRLGSEFNEDTATESQKARRQKLTDVGFVFEQSRSRKTGGPMESWSVMFSKLQAFKQKYNTLSVPVQYDDKLSKWKLQQVYRYRKYEKGEASSLTYAQFQQLRNICLLDGERNVEGWFTMLQLAATRLKGVDGPVELPVREWLVKQLECRDSLDKTKRLKINQFFRDYPQVVELPNQQMHNRERNVIPDNEAEEMSEQGEGLPIRSLPHLLDTGRGGASPRRAIQDAWAIMSERTFPVQYKKDPWGADKWATLLRAGTRCIDAGNLLTSSFRSQLVRSLTSTLTLILVRE